MQKNLYIAAFALLGLIIAFFLFQKNPTFPPPTAGENIIVFGDSLAFGLGSTAGNDIASRLAANTGLPVINAGVNGDTAITAERRLNQDVLSQNPRVVIILLGGNDFLRRIPPDQTMTALEKIVDKILQTGSGIILVNENKIFGTTSRFKDLAKEKNIPYIEHVLDGIIGEKELMFDQIHPNDLGYEIMSDKIEEVLLSYLQPQ